LDTNFSKILTLWYLGNKRDLPWRKTNDAYKIWLSEIILQQTKVAQGLPYFLAFVERFPSVDFLAKASEEEVLKMWQGLGYYSRARNLLAAALMVMSDFNGVFPVAYNDLVKLKGVGVYTASAIASFSNNENVAVVDGNVYRVLSRIFGVYTPINSSEGVKEYNKIANSLLSKEDPAMHNQAIMEFGALCCTPKKSQCNTCVFNDRCYAFKNQVVDKLPVKVKKIKIRKRYFNFIVCRSAKGIILQKRIGKGIWENMYQLPLIETEKNLDVSDFLKEDGVEEFNFDDIHLIYELDRPHKLSHQHIFAKFYEVDSFDINDSSYVEILYSKLEEYPVPVLISRFLENYVL